VEDIQSEVNAMLAPRRIQHLHTGVYSEVDHSHEFLTLTLHLTATWDRNKVEAVKADGSGLEFVAGGGEAQLAVAWLLLSMASKCDCNREPMLKAVR
jgi:hypothetical protein